MRKTILLFFIVLIGSCSKKDNTPPTIILKTGVGYISADVVLPPSTTFIVGVDAHSGASDLDIVYLEVAYDGANTARLVERLYTNSSQKSHYERDMTITTRSSPGTERWLFNVNDVDGRISKQEIRVTVQ